MRQFHSLKVLDKQRETRDSLRLTLDVPEALRGEFAFLPGQHLPIRAEHNDESLRRTYSICSAPGEWPLQIGVRVQPGGRFSDFADNVLKAGDSLDVMPPFGRFHLQEQAAGTHLAFAAGSGITPILAIVTALLARDEDSQVILFYGNRRQSTTMFIEDLFALKNRYTDRLQLHFVFSREEQEFDVLAGRLDREKVRELWQHFVRDLPVQSAYLCGPDSMIDDVTQALSDCGLATSDIHAERFGAPRKSVAAKDAAPHPAAAEVTVIMDGHKQVFEMHDDDGNLVDAAALHGIDLPYSCKAGVCATCRCHVRDGAVDMASHYGLEDWEVDAGFVLACQSAPTTKSLTLDYDKA